MLINPICILGFAYASWSFFRHRIPYEEQGLEQFFGPAYVAYKAKTPTCPLPPTTTHTSTTPHPRTQIYTHIRMILRLHRYMHTSQRHRARRILTRSWLTHCPLDIPLIK